MSEVLDALLNWWHADQPAGLATVTATWSSAPRQPGSAMAVNERRRGSSAASPAAASRAAVYWPPPRRSSKPGRPSRNNTLRGERRRRVRSGLTCGGTIEGDGPACRLGRLTDLDDVLAAAISRSGPVATRHPSPIARTTSSVIWPSTGWPARSARTTDLDGAAEQDAAGMLVVRRHRHCSTSGEHGQQRMAEGLRCSSSVPPPPRMIVFGAIDFAGAVARIGGFLGYHVTVCDARPVFATRAIFPSADELVVQWPHLYLRNESYSQVDERTVLCVLTHDPKFDVPLLEVALPTPPAHRRDGQPPYPCRPDAPPARGRRVRGRAVPFAAPDRPGPGRPHPRGDGGGVSPARSSRCAGAAVALPPTLARGGRSIAESAAALAGPGLRVTPRSARRHGPGADVQAFALRAEEVEDLRGLRAGLTTRCGTPGVELGDLARRSGRGRARRAAGAAGRTARTATRSPRGSCCSGGSPAAGAAGRICLNACTPPGRRVSGRNVTPSRVRSGAGARAGRRWRARRPARRAAPGGPWPAAAAARGWACGRRTPAGTGC